MVSTTATHYHNALAVLPQLEMAKRQKAARKGVRLLVVHRFKEHLSGTRLILQLPRDVIRFALTERVFQTDEVPSVVLQYRDPYIDRER